MAKGLAPAGAAVSSRINLVLRAACRKALLDEGTNYETFGRSPCLQPATGLDGESTFFDLSRATSYAVGWRGKIFARPYPGRPTETSGLFAHSLAGTPEGRWFAEGCTAESVEDWQAMVHDRLAYPLPNPGEGYELSKDGKAVFVGNGTADAGPIRVGAFSGNSPIEAATIMKGAGIRLPDALDALVEEACRPATLPEHPGTSRSKG